ncbi:Phosphatidylinositol 3,4,5-trisphosphate-dependent Rac exchanger 1 protein [Colletotrichum siamense]|uniref:Phosphatidylinositol 3,4,5-trisphosphate-dependent Rac exchanger 1 protein n=1 Tax=Colletotrichum siamense TaxID=690259 RepID=A0A9P5EYJ6_COLSI|nr:Phosphatidylinositol 3,4,5-trisphosphate-dependent Rac exchanger 1 protein [Colletotrichum siamense]KAF4862981.1 Phosphatidylinositol 3,4,5-trisphosphate-dependent Rac exchanger 1 protein [Colletotrichum siamense]
MASPSPPDSTSIGTSSRSGSVRITRKTCPATSSTPSPTPRQNSSTTDDQLEDVDLSSELDGLHIDGVEVWDTLSGMAAFGLEHDSNNSSGNTTPFPRISMDDSDDDVQELSESDAPGKHHGPFHKWMRNLHRRARQRPKAMNADGTLPWKLLDPADRSALSRRTRHRRSSSGSSFGFVAAVRSASVSLASGSVMSRPRGYTRRSFAQSRTDRSSRASFTATRCSEDSCHVEWPVRADPMATERALQRRRILEELIQTEEGYIGDIRFLMNVYITILASLPTLPMGLRSSINRNLTDIVELHEELLGELHRVVPDSEYSQADVPATTSKVPTRGHQRLRSLDSVPEDDRAISWLQDVPGMMSEAQTAGAVAKVFSRKMNRFFVYEEYGAKYELMIKDVASAHRTMPQWDTYQRGIEALASSLGSANSHADQSKKSLTIGDLLVKPIQRICKYPLLFAELLKYTPVADCPNSHMEVESALLRLREATAEINRATNDTRMKSTLEKTWILQDRLAFPEQKLDAASKNRIRSFGHVELCGVLHICWQTKEGAKGQYMICLLYHNILCLASASKVDQIYTIQACVNLNGIKIEETDNGRGLQCHTAPFSWKLVFECDSQLYEILMTACTPREQEEWRRRLSIPNKRNEEQVDPNLYSSIALPIRSLGTVFRKPGTVARRISIHRATTVGPKSPLCQVILKNTSVMRDGSEGTSSSSINRSQSLLTTANPRIPVIAPPRGERARLEALMSDIWSRDVLPFPSMNSRSRSEHLVRSSASTVMRKLSVASIASSFAKRSNSVASIGKFMSEDDSGEKQEDAHHGPSTKLTKAEPFDAKHVSDDEASETTTARLPKIDDDVEFKSTVSAPTTPMLGPVKLDVHADPIERLRLECDKGVAGNALHSRPIVLRTASGNNIPRARRSPMPSKRSPRPLDAVNQARAQKMPRLSHKPSLRWGRVGTLNKEDWVQGIRSFFR